MVMELGADETSGRQRQVRAPSILVVDDNPDLRTTVRDILEYEGYSVITAENGRQALEVLTQPARPCLILLDLMMPVMDGWEFLEEQRSHAAWREIPVVILSALAHRPESKSLGAAGILGKPVKPEMLFELIRKYCGDPPDPH
jgi:CheY-like chemotaxis protein